MIDREQALEKILASPLADLAESLAERLEPSIRLGVKAVQPNDLPLGASRFGGTPDLPADLAWPHYAGRPLGLAAQLALEELAPFDVRGALPPHGWLYFFFDAANESPWDEHQAERSWRVLFYDGELGSLRRLDPPPALSKHNTFRWCAVGLRSELTLPSFGATRLDGLDFPAERREEYEDLIFSLHGLPPIPTGNHGKLHQFVSRVQHRLIGDPIHRVFGHPEHFQIDPRVDWQKMAEHAPVVSPTTPELRTAARPWELLLQVDAYQDGPTWLWGDNGTLYFGIRPADLAARNFDQVQWTVECG